MAKKFMEVQFTFFKFTFTSRPEIKFSAIIEFVLPIKWFLDKKRTSDINPKIIRNLHQIHNYRLLNLTNHVQILILWPSYLITSVHSDFSEYRKFWNTYIFLNRNFAEKKIKCGEFIKNLATLWNVRCIFGEKIPHEHAQFD